MTWFTILDIWIYQRPVEIDICLCEEREEGESICQPCWEKAKGWHKFMAEAPRACA